MKRYEIRDDKGKALESGVKGFTESEAIERIKALADENPKRAFVLLSSEVIYDTANPPFEIEF